MKRRGPCVRERLQALRELRGGHREVGDHQRHPEGEAFAREVDHDVLDGLAGLLLEPLDQVAAQPARRRRRQRGDDDLVDRLGAHGVHGGVERIGIADLALADRPEVADELQRQVHADLRGVAHDLVVDDVPVPRLGLRDDDEESCARLTTFADAIEQRLAGDRLVREDEHRRHWLDPLLRLRAATRGARR